jgi:HEPN domain-containing protein
LNRHDFRRLARTRLREARVLLTAREWSGAYYLCGYAIECGIKACIAKNFQRYEFPSLQTVKDSYTHDFGTLLKAAGLGADHKLAVDHDPVFEINWAVVKDWKSEARYAIKSEAQARDLYRAVTSRTSGIFAWIRARW